MDLFFADPSEVPLPPDEVRIRSLLAEPYPDGRRVRVSVEIDPFQRRPNAELAIEDAGGRELASASVIESMTRKFSMTLHLRGDVSGPLTLTATLFYAQIDPPPEPDAEPGPPP
ncbi:MAG: hypothetical protein ACKOC5_00800, partial [Chloroflexota bacterium]